jgi:hypothetical protein
MRRIPQERRLCVDPKTGRSSREDDRKEGRQMPRLRARRWAPGCCCGMRSRANRAELSARSIISSGLPSLGGNFASASNGQAREVQRRTSRASAADRRGSRHCLTMISLTMINGRCAQIAVTRRQRGNRVKGDPTTGRLAPKRIYRARRGHNDISVLLKSCFRRSVVLAVIGRSLLSRSD